MTKRRPIPRLGLAIAAALCFAPISGAFADVIDGDWCHADGRQMSIKGPEVVTPSGTHMTGDYTRHSFAYVVPASDPGAGQTVAMILVNEQTVDLRVGADRSSAAAAPTQVWHRCTPKTSAIGTAATPS
jgi:hypothetical protein